MYRDHRQPSTYENLERTYKNHLGRVLGSTKLADLHIGHINGYKKLRKIENALREKNKQKKGPAHNEPDYQQRAFLFLRLLEMVPDQSEYGAQKNRL
jgi:hypothetical protein